MIRACLLPIAFAFGATATAADLPKDISPEDRTAFIKRHAELAASERADWIEKAEAAKTLMKFAATAKEGKSKLATAEAALSRLEKTPWRVRGTDQVVIGERKQLLAGDVGFFSPLGEYVATKVPEGVQIDGLIDPTGQKLILRVLIASPFTIPKVVKGKNSPLFSPAELWYVAGFVDIKGKSVPVLYRFEIKPGDFPPAK